MSFDSIKRLIEEIEKQPGWEIQQQYRLVLQCWNSVVGPQVAVHARPLSIARQILWVATSSSAWAQNLSMQRYSLLKKLNARLSEQLIDIRFSPAKWHNRDPLHDSKSGSQKQDVNKENTSSVSSPPEGQEPQTAFQRWAEVIRERSENFPVCPWCQCPTPKNELERWNVCSFCAAQQWRQESPRDC